MMTDEQIEHLEREAARLRRLADDHAAVARDQRRRRYEAEPPNYQGSRGCLINGKAAGLVEGQLYCYGGCGTPYYAMGHDVLLPTALWNRITTGPPFNPTEYPGIEREGRGGVLCAACTIERLSKLGGVTGIFVDIDDFRQREAQPPTVPAAQPEAGEPCFICTVPYAGHDIIDEATGRVGRLKIDFTGKSIRRPLHWFEPSPAPVPASEPKEAK